MTLREAYEICKREEKKIKEYEMDIRDYCYNISDEEYFSTRYLGTCKEFYGYVNKNLSSLPFIAPKLDMIRNYIENIDITDANMLLEIIEEVCQRIYCIIPIYESLENHNENNYAFEVKIPKIDDITELKKFIDGLEFVFTKCPFFQHKEESLKLQSVANGSILFIFCVIGVVGASIAVGSVLLNNIAAFIYKCFIIKSIKSTCEQQKQHVENEKMEQQEKIELLKSVNKLYKISVNHVIKDLEASTGYQIQDGDEMGRVEQSFDRMIKMLDQGLQIHSAINSSEEVKELFAPLEMHYLSIERGLERIEDKKDTDSK